MPATVPPAQRIGEGLVKAGTMTEEQVRRVLEVQREQRGYDRLFGEIAVELRFVDQATIESYLRSAHGEQ